MNRTLKRKNTKRKKIRIFLFSLLTLILLVGGYSAYLTYKVANASQKAHEDLSRGTKSKLRTQPVDLAKDNFSVLFIGVDTRPGDEENTRSDALIFTTFNKDEKSIKMVSIPRDSRVKIPGHKMDKITHAHAFGGKDLTVETVEDLFNTQVDYYVELDFNAFIEVIDALNGIEINSEREFTEQDSKDTKNAIHIKQGIQTVNGEEALAYVRMRKKDPLGDIGRGKRQQEVIKAIIEKTGTFSSITKYDNIVETIGENLKTNFSIGNILALYKYAGSINNIESLSLEGKDRTINDIYYYELNKSTVKEVSKQLKQHLENPTELNN